MSDVIVAPTPGGGLTHAKAQVETPYGVVASEWQTVAGRLELNITVPPNTRAQIALPAAEANGISEGDRALRELPEASEVRAVNGRVNVHCARWKLPFLRAPCRDDEIIFFLAGISPCEMRPLMKKNFPLHVPGKADARVLDAIKGEVRKYVKRERRKPVREGVDFWDFDCRVGADHASAEVKSVTDLGKAIDEAAASGSESVYVEILAKPGLKPPRVPRTFFPTDTQRADNPSRAKPF